MGIDLTPEELERLGIHNRSAKKKICGKPPKYKNKPTDVYDGNSKYHCDSKAEAVRIMELIGLRNAGMFADFVFKPRVRLDAITYIADNLVVDANDSYAKQITGHLPGGPFRSWYEDPKGVETQRFRDIRKLWKANGRLPLRVIKGKKDDWVIPDRLISNEDQPEVS